MEEEIKRYNWRRDIERQTEVITARHPKTAISAIAAQSRKTHGVLCEVTAEIVRKQTADMLLKKCLVVAVD
jgi:hypothetical protein